MVAKININKFDELSSKFYLPCAISTIMTHFFDVYKLEHGQCYIYIKMNEIILTQEDRQILMSRGKNGFFVESNDYTLNVRRIAGDKIKVVEYREECPNEAKEKFTMFRDTIELCTEYLTDEQWKTEIQKIFKF